MSLVDAHEMKPKRRKRFIFLFLFVCRDMVIDDEEEDDRYTSSLGNKTITRTRAPRARERTSSRRHHMTKTKSGFLFTDSILWFWFVHEEKNCSCTSNDKKKGDILAKERKMFPALSGGKVTDRRRDNYETRLVALQLAEQHQRALLRRDVENKVEMSHRPSIREPLRKDIQSRNAYVQLFRSPHGDAAAADALLHGRCSGGKWKPNASKGASASSSTSALRPDIDIVGLLPEFARAVAKYEKVLAVMEEEDREFDELCKAPLLANRFKRPNPAIMRPRVEGAASSAPRTKYSGAAAVLAMPLAASQQLQLQQRISGTTRRSGGSGTNSPGQSTRRSIVSTRKNSGN